MGILTRPAAFNQDIKALVSHSFIVPKFLAYSLALRHGDLLGLVDSAGHGTGRLNTDQIKSLPIWVPSIKEQTRIVGILGAIDDKIELNRRMCATLEETARTIFRSWFVDFDPVRAKAAAIAEGRDPERAAMAAISGKTDAELDALPAETFASLAQTAAFFPNELTKSELGDIPDGWEIGTLGKITNVIDCLHSKKPRRTITGKPFLQLSNIRDDGLLDMSDTYWISEEDYIQWISRIEASTGDCVITNVGRVGAVAQIPGNFRAAIGRNMTAIQCRADFPYPAFLITCLLSDAMKQEIENKKDAGTILESLNVRNIPRLRFVLPNRQLVHRAEMIFGPLRKHMEANLQSSHTLMALRNTLLPRLLSGSLSPAACEDELKAVAS